MTLYNSAQRFSETRYWTGFDWRELVQVVDGSLIVLGSISGNALKIGSGLAVDSEGNVFVSNLNADVITAGIISALLISGDVLNIVPLWPRLTGPQTLRIDDHQAVQTMTLERDIPGTGTDSLRSLFGIARNNSGRGGSSLIAVPIGDLVVDSDATAAPSTAIVVSVQGSDDVAQAVVWRPSDTSDTLYFQALAEADDLTITDVFGIKGVPRPPSLALPAIGTSPRKRASSSACSCQRRQAAPAITPTAWSRASTGCPTTPTATDFRGTPSGAGNFSVTYTVDDGETSTSRTFTVSISQTLSAARAPSLAISPVSSVGEGDSLSLSVTRSGGVYDTISYEWTVLSGGGSFSDSVGSSATYDAPAVSANTTVRVRCTATARGTGVNAAAGSAATSSDTESFTVTADLPAASAPKSPSRQWPRWERATRSRSRLASIAPASTTPSVMSGPC